MEKIYLKTPPPIAKKIHPSIINSLYLLQDQEKVLLTNGELDENKLKTKIEENIKLGKYALVILDWEKWNSQAQEKFGNPRHIVTVFDISGDSVYIIDPSVEVNPVKTTVSKLFNSLNQSQQIVFIGKEDK